MTEKQPNDSQTDALTREIEGLLAVDPSTEFLARVRTRLAEESPSTRKRWWNTLTASIRVRHNLQRMATWGAIVATVMVLAAITTYKRNYESALLRQRKTEQAKVEARMLKQVNAGLSRSVPRAMAPLMGWAPGEK